MPSAKQRVIASRRRFRMRQKTMNTVQVSKTATSIFIGRWTPKVLFSLKQRPYRQDSCAANWEPFHNECSRELCAIWNPRV